jgi:3-dehydroquinate dehydratase/shikimate dehydrogenase
LFGFNTDVYGIVAAIEPRVPLQGARVLVLGAGGAARAAVFGLRSKGAEVSILNRTQATALALAKQSGSTTVKRSELPKLNFDIIFNATPVGMGADPSTPLEEHELNALWVFDSVYNPIETPLLKLAQSKGCGTISGAEMYVHQAARQFEIWTGKPAPIDLIRQVLLRQLGAAGVVDSASIPTVVAPKAKAMAANAIASDASAAEVAGPASAAPAEPAKAEPEAVAKTAAKKAPPTAVDAKAPAAKAKNTTAKTAGKATSKAGTKTAARRPGKAKR